MDRYKVDDESTDLSLRDLHKGARESRKWVDRVFLRAILQVYIELDRIEIMMMQVEGAVSDRCIGIEGNRTCIHLDVRIVCVELGYEE